MLGIASYPRYSDPIYTPTNTDPPEIIMTKKIDKGNKEKEEEEE
jgi:hypothetical protein